MKIAIITTVNHNVGDDFVREGLKYLLRKHFADRELNFTHIHKHSPITSRKGFEWFRNLLFSRKVDPLIPIGFTPDRIMEADLVVQSGAPVYWCHEADKSHCCDNEWFNPLIRRRFRMNPNAKLINLAAGSCQRYHSDGTEFCERCNAFIEEFYESSSVTTVRDHLAQKILGKVGLNAPVIPCSSIFARDELQVEASEGEYVVVNYMKGGAHFTFGQKIEIDRWESEFKKFYFELRKKERVIFSCHNEKEVTEAKTIDPNAQIFFHKNDYLAYVKFYSKAKYGIMNRVHGAFLMASFGKPSLIIGNDSRARMAAEIGMESVFVNDASTEMLFEKQTELAANTNDYSTLCTAIREKAERDYLKAIERL